MMPVFDSVQEAQDFYERELAQRDEELRELIQQWRDYGGRVQGEDYYNGTLNGLDKAADELEALLDER